MNSVKTVIFECDSEKCTTVWIFNGTGEI